MNQRKFYGNGQRTSRGFSTLELLLVMVVSLVIAALAIPGFNQVRRTLRISGDARNLNGAINQAKLQAAADFTEARVYFDLTPLSPANPFAKYHIDVWNKALNSGNGCWQTVGDLDAGGQPRCLIDGTSPVQYLSSGVTFGFAGVAAPPPNTTTGIQQAPNCLPWNGKKIGWVATSACAHFNSRGVPITPATGVPTGNDAVYITDGTQVYGVTLSPTGLTQVWANNITGQANWYRK